MLLGGNLDPSVLIANLLVLLIGMTIHEWSHNYVAWRMGDPEPKIQGRLTLNPFVHINWIGWLMFALIGFGILGSAPISPYRMPYENRRWRWLAAVAAGPISNLILAALFALVLRLLLATDLLNAQNFAVDLLVAILSQGVILNLVLFFFNLIPLFPLDGWQIVLALLPPDLAHTWQRYQQATYYIFFGLILISLIRLPGIPSPLGILVTQPTIALYRLFLGL
ncbi:MAG TPA: site-2 protease family protein [Candidatus Limnocylindrales bacterium]|nr:site-2 protease family protein [Candidatus Limnocylindrales bacterium]